MKHYLITMFNIYRPYQDQKKLFNNDSYLKERFELFEKYTVPSVKA